MAQLVPGIPKVVTLISSQFAYVTVIMLFVVDAFLFSEDTSRNSANIVQCQQSGISNCRPVILDTEHLTSRLQLGQYVKFIAGSDIEMQVSPVSCYKDKEPNIDCCCS